MPFHRWKPETLARHAREAKERTRLRHASMITELEAKAKAEGAGSIWAEMLAETLARDALEPDRFA